MGAGLLPGGDGVGADAAVGRGQVYGEAGRRLGVGPGVALLRRLLVQLRRALVGLGLGEVLPVVGLRGERGSSVLRVLVLVSLRRRGLARAGEHLALVHVRLRRGCAALLQHPVGQAGPRGRSPQVGHG